MDGAGVEQLPDLVAALPEGERVRFARLFELVVSEGACVPPEQMHARLAQMAGSLERACRQCVVRITNRWTLEGSILNPLRARRPGSRPVAGSADLFAALDEMIARSRGDDFCDPLHRTPEDVFGRIRGAHVLTASNLAKADGWHAVGIFDRHDPLQIDTALVQDALAVAYRWALAAHETDPAARHFFMLWNCLGRAGASQLHGHIQMTLGAGMPHARVEAWRAAAQRYHRETGHDYFADLIAAHQALGLAIELGDVTLLCSLTPLKEREIVLLAPPPAVSGEAWSLESLASALARTLDVVLRTLGVLAFNAVLFGPPLGPAPPHADAGWEGFPLIVRFVDRGDPLSTSSDIGGLELFGSSVVSADPFALAHSLCATL